MSTLKAIRERLAATQAALSEVMGCTQGNVSFYEKGQTVPPEAAKLLIDYARARGLEITFDHIYGNASLPPVDVEAESRAALSDAARPILIIKPTPKKGA